MAKKIKADTLLRKIQKGNSSVELGKAGSKVPSFSFNENGGIQMFKKREIVQPYLHPIDSHLINEQVSKTVKNALKNVDPDIERNYDKLLPKHLVNDLYSLYYNQSNKLKFEGLDKTNKVKFDILDSINNSLIKIVTNGSNIGSYVYTEAISNFLYKKFMTMPPEQRKKLEEALNNCNQNGNGNGGQGQQPQGKGPGNQPGKSQGGNDPNNAPPGQGRPEEDQDSSGRQDSTGTEQGQRNNDVSGRGAANNSHGNNSEKDMSQEAADKLDEDLKKMVDMLNNKQSQKELEQAFKQAEEKLDKLRDIGVDLENDEELPEEEKREIISNLNNLDSIRQSLRSLSTSKDKIMKAVNKILNGTTNYFSQKCIQTDVELFEADQLLDINGIEFLHPFFRNSRLLDLSVTERKYIGKFDLYVDCSGSMSSGCHHTGDLRNVSRIDLAKSLAMQMRELGILGELYEFEDRPKKIMNTDMSILMMDARGGTNLEAVMKNIVKNGNNAVVLSDGESHVETYSHKALFIGVGTDFHYFKSYGEEEGAGKKFVRDGQCIHFDGKDFVETTPMNSKDKPGRY
jgi:hypothetical protein